MYLFFSCRKGSNTDDTLQQMSLKLYRADYHGCILKIDRSLCPGYVGKSGIVAMETKNCFRIVGQDNIVRSKKGFYVKNILKTRLE